MAVLAIGVLVSGRGSNLEAILRAVQRGAIRRAKVSVVISNRPDVRALVVAKRYGVPAELLDSSSFQGDRLDYDRKLIELLSRHGVSSKYGLVLLAGFDRILSPEFVHYYRERLMNIHPSLLPAFPGLRAQKQALDHGVKVTGCTVHFVVPEVDAGPIIVQKAVPVREGDTPDSLSERILRQEHRIYPAAVRLFVENKIRVSGRTVRIQD